MDTLTKEQRHNNMVSIRSKDTSPEIKLRKELFKRGYRYRKNLDSLPGKPDIVLPIYSTVIFVHGCFWHRHPGCKRATMPKSNIDYWKKKFERNIENDNRTRNALEMLGWTVIEIWECEIKKDVIGVVDNIEDLLSRERSL